MFCTIYITGVDDAESECGLDEGIHWDYLIHNNGDQDLLDKDIDHLVTIVQEKLCDMTWEVSIEINQITQDSREDLFFYPEDLLWLLFSFL